MRRSLLPALLCLCVLLLLPAFACADTGSGITLAYDGFEFPGYYDKGSGFSPKGRIKCSESFDGVAITVYNKRSMSNEQTLSDKFDPTTQYTADKLLNRIRFAGFSAGEKVITVYVHGDFGTKELMHKEFYVRGDTSAVLNMNADCRFTDSAGNRVASVQDNAYLSSWKNKGKDYIRIDLPKGRTSEGMLLQWEKPPKQYYVKGVDKNGNTVLTVDDTNPDAFWNIYVDIPQTVRTLYVTTGETSNSLCEIRVYETGHVSEVVQKWEPWPDDMDLILITAHKNDETLYFSGTIPLCVEEGRNVGVVVLTEHGNRFGQEELFECLWEAGIRIHPIILNKWDGKDSYKKIAEIWGGYGNTCSELVSILRKYRPEVVLTHDRNGEFGHIEHIMTSDLTVDAVERAADPAEYPESAEKYGAWDTPKLYVHLYDESKRLHLPFDEPLEQFGNRTAMEVAYGAFDKYRTQITIHYSYSLDSDGKIYDKTFFGLYRSTVGEDIAKNSFFEHIDNPPEPASVPEPIPEPSAAPEPVSGPGSGSSAEEIPGERIRKPALRIEGEFLPDSTDP